jgi:hypothetical protein
MTKQGSINLNVNLLKTPEDVIDYIYIHFQKYYQVWFGLDLSVPLLYCISLIIE